MFPSITCVRANTPFTESLNLLKGPFQLLLVKTETLLSFTSITVITSLVVGVSSKDVITRALHIRNT